MNDIRFISLFKKNHKSKKSENEGKNDHRARRVCSSSRGGEPSVVSSRQTTVVEWWQKPVYLIALHWSKKNTFR